MDSLGSYRGRQRGDWRDYPWPASTFTDLWDPYNNWDIGRRGVGNDDITYALAHAHVDWRETDTAHIFRADLPGVKKEDLKVQVEDNKILQISGERVKEKEDQNDKWHRVERQCGSFKRRFRLPEDANSEQIGCTLENGVLTVTVPKIETKPENKNVRLINVA
ncbi:16.9 kDa class I heat shock protein 3-like [Abrus precatorius]|uniref:16.9 kDa class I heat shock protein 3-like n=1 Tax=Abrus precatorius TaxID=3816 RepID=A0A8B8LVQ2_ABRPR|nr:16.9 kDa class I heat shock protein 3-like [Abrus precatorius]